MKAGQITNMILQSTSFKLRDFALIQTCFHDIFFPQVRDGREHDTVAFTELHLKLQRSSIIRNRESILTLMLCLSERKNRGGSKKVPPFSSVSVTTVNGTVESGGVTVVGAGNNILSDTKSFLSSVIPAPYRSRPTTLRWSTCVLIYFSCLLDHVIYL